MVFNVFMAHKIHRKFVKCKHYVCLSNTYLPVKLKAMEKQTEKENKKAAFVRLTKILIEKGIKPPDFQRAIGIASQD